MVDDPNYYSEPYWAYSYQARGLYYEQIQRWLEYFPREQMLILSSERFFANPQSTYDRCLNFLEQERFVPNSFQKQNTGSYKDMDISTKKTLSAKFREHNTKLFDFIGEDFEWTS